VAPARSPRAGSIDTIEQTCVGCWSGRRPNPASPHWPGCQGRNAHSIFFSGHPAHPPRRNANSA
jgi:hypothetical protein